MHHGYATHRTGIALYLHISNAGSAASAIESVHLAYHWPMKPLTNLWWRNTIGWFWLTDQAAALEDFQVAIGDNVKVYPFLFQLNNLSGTSANTYLDIGQTTNGVIYFEQGESYGGCQPAKKDGKTKIIVRIVDAFGRKHNRRFQIPCIELEEARTYNPSFGKTFSELHGIPLPFDITTEAE
ncbi:hypothetical protein V8J38_10665 [Brevundimonas olei]|uniref:Uncharacterized protein n=1 Tax=Brevundimonas olei TaxID=657642 RepID=A0ABZ2IFN9_9CAUL